jgi:hypothetical protein
MSKEDWYLTSPFEVLELAASNRHRDEDILSFYAMPFLAIWAVAATLLNLPWLLRQFRRFAPPRVSRPASQPLVLVLADSEAKR